VGKLIHEQLTYRVRGVLMDVHLHTLDLQLGLLANFHDPRLHIQPVRIAR